jgi:hypothetical protein
LQGRKAMRRKFYMHKRGGVFYACLVNQETGFSINARSTGERDRDAALIVVSGWLRDGLPGKDGERRKVEARLTLREYSGAYGRRNWTAAGHWQS